MSQCVQLSFGGKRGNECLRVRALPVPEKDVSRENKRPWQKNGWENSVRNEWKQTKQAAYCGFSVWFVYFIYASFCLYLEG